MRKGQVSKSFFCPFCATPAVGQEWNGSSWWAQGCSHAIRPVRLGPKRRAETAALYERRMAFAKERQARAIADCSGEPVAVP